MNTNITPAETDEPVPLKYHNANDIAGLYSYAADRVRLHVIDDKDEILAVGFATDGSGRATGRVAWIRDGQYSRSWDADRSQFGTCKGVVHLRTTEDLHALVVWLRGEA